MQDLPAPINGTEAYLAAILAELRALRLELSQAQAGQAQAAPSAPAELREPKQQHAKRR
jgi:hypothetical protein